MFVVSKCSLKIVRFFLPLGVEYNLLLRIWCLWQVSLQAGDGNALSSEWLWCSVQSWSFVSLTKLAWYVCVVVLWVYGYSVCAWGCGGCV